MKFICLTIISLIISVKVSLGQEVYKAFDTGIYSDSKKLKGAHYYYVNADTAVLLPVFKDKLLLDTCYLKEKTITLLAIYEKQKIVFKIRPDKFFYIKINILKEDQPEYEINLGLEYVTTVKASIKNFILR
jgi:hypothetical protein